MRHLQSIFFLALFYPALACSAAVELRLRETANTRDQAVTLEEIAEVDMDPARPQLLAALRRSVVIADAQPGGVLFFTRDQVLRWFGVHHPELRGELRMSGAPFTKVEVHGQALIGEVYVSAARDCLRGWLSRNHTKFAIQEPAVARTLAVPAGPLVVSARSCDFQLGERITVFVDILVNGSLHQKVPVTFGVDAVEVVWVATREIKALAPLDASAFVREERDLAALARPAVRNIDQLRGARARQMIRPGQVLTQAQLEPAPDVTKGSKVTVIAQVGGITISKGAMALADGNAAQDVEVANIGGPGRYRARVVGKNTVAVE